MNTVTEKEKQIFKYLCRGGEDLALTRTLFNGIETSAIVWLDQQQDGSYEITPLAVIVSEEIFNQLELLNNEEFNEQDNTGLMEENNNENKHKGYGKAEKI